MTNIHSTLCKGMVAFIMLTAFHCVQPLKAQDFSKAIARADTTRFSPNKKEGWELFNSYVSEDERGVVSLEFIIQHDLATIDWTRHQLIGKIKGGNLYPKKDVRMPFKLIYDLYEIMVEVNGTCYLRLTEGKLPPGDPVILPVQVKYLLQ